MQGPTLDKERLFIKPLHYINSLDIDQSDSIRMTGARHPQGGSPTGPPTF